VAAKAKKKQRRKNKEKKPTLSPALALYVVQHGSKGAGGRYQPNRELAACVNSRDLAVVVVVVECASGEKRPKQSTKGKKWKWKNSVIISK
jgi:hypothetical protein